MSAVVCGPVRGHMNRVELLCDTESVSGAVRLFYWFGEPVEKYARDMHPIYKLNCSL